MFIRQFFALLVIFTLAYAQTLLLMHEKHSTEHRHDLSNEESSAHVLTLKCGICDYIFHKQSDPALILSPQSLTITLPAIDFIVDRSFPGITHRLIGQHLNRGPPLA